MELAGSRPRRQRHGGVTGTTEFDSGPPVGSGPPVDSAPPLGRGHVESASGAVGMISMDVDNPACEGDETEEEGEGKVGPDSSSSGEDEVDDEMSCLDPRSLTSWRTPWTRGSYLALARAASQTGGGLRHSGRILLLVVVRTRCATLRSTQRY